MRSFKKLLKIIFGQATPFQLFLGCLLGFILGFIPGFSYAPFLMMLAIFFVIIFNVNIGFVVITYIISKIISFLIEGISFYVGCWLLDGPLQFIFKWLINTPVFAYLGFDYYLVAGGFVIAVILGIIIGLIVVCLFKTVRNKMAVIQTNSEMYQKIVNKFSVKLISWVLMGKSAHKIDWVLLKNKKLKHPFRLSGVILVIVIIILLFVFHSFLQSKMVSNILQSQLSKINGATVDFKSLNINLKDAELSVKGLGFSNPQNLEMDRFFADNLNAKINISHLLTKRLSLEKVIVNGISFDHQRVTKGVLVNNQAIESNKIAKENKNKDQNKEVKQANNQKMDTYSIDHYMKNAKKYHQYLASINRLLNMIGNNNQKDNLENNKDTNKTMTNEVKLYGYANVRATHLIDQFPTLTIESLKANEIKSNFDHKVFNLDAKNLATEPYLLNKPTNIHLISTDQSIKLNLINSNNQSSKNSIELSLKNLPAKTLLENIQFSQNFSLTADSFSLKTKGKWFIKDQTVFINLPINLKLDKTNIKVNNTNTSIDQLTLQFKVTGSLNKPLLEIKKDQMKDILLQTGTSEIKNKLNQKIKDKLPSFGF